MAHPLPPSALHDILTMFDSSPNRRSRPIGRLRKGLVAENGDREAAAGEGRCSVNNNGHSLAPQASRKSDHHDRRGDPRDYRIFAYGLSLFIPDLHLGS